ncbi:hypothetical protein QFZ77_003211 [Paenibacillus sp. V4I3]|uniref:IS3 family transposase n=1 Tax=Paenibacillus sp. V4I3 TaxID=3042305 RepID=UPI002781A80C|nr:IS3 family transposase [Paenibacillus sp. V4I3]MDQ0874552.1 hypothetical protein [Paenibacillus sp. V4I3]
MDCPEHAIIVQADLLSLNRTSLNYKPIPPSPEEIRLKHRIDELYTKHPFIGYRTIASIMNRENDAIHKNTVRRYMREMGLYAVMDWYSRYIVDWQLDKSLEIGFVLETMKRGLAKWKPGI